MKLSIFGTLIVGAALLTGCAYFPNTVEELKESRDPIEAELPMSLDDVQISIQAYNQRCLPELDMERDLTNTKRAFYSEWHMGDLLEHIEWVESPDGATTRVSYWHVTAPESYFLERKLHSMSNPEECIYYWL